MDAVLYVVDLARMVAFYRDGLRLAELSRHDGGAELRCGACTLHLVTVPESVAAEIVITDPPVRREETPIKLIVPVENLAEARRRAEEHGGVVDGPDHEWVWADSWRVDAVDPEGNVVQLAAPRQH
ncbi:VOC family protein [Mycobacterium sp. M26]|uniref:VOC family protein n=1 Tax=Mycobacterium sp. M26 TaxID=1762962 RepID=UPI00073E3A70|nr:VOC family protein [Mycobacterium sp. M26]